jgi:hypothetical protein
VTRRCDPLAIRTFKRFTMGHGSHQTIPGSRVSFAFSEEDSKPMKNRDKQNQIDNIYFRITTSFQSRESCTKSILLKNIMNVIDCMIH